MTLTLRLRSEPPLSIDLEPLAPELAGELNADQIQRLPLHVGRQRTELGEWFAVEGRSDGTLRFEGDCSTVDGIGSRWNRGELIVDGEAGDRLGRRMAGGTIHVRGSAGSFVASGLSGGRVVIDGDVGEWLGGPLRGERTGMRGGRVVVHGSAGAGAGHRLRRGTVIVNGQVGPRCGWEMVAGTLVAGSIDPTDLGFAMRRGTILILDAPAADAFPVGAPCFSPTTEAPLVFLRLLLDDLAADCQGARERPASGWRRSLGDLSRGGLGEVIG